MSQQPSPTFATAGAPLAAANLAVVMVHGRGATAGDILALADDINLDQVHYVAPQAPGNTWYPYRFIEPVAKNEPFLSASLMQVGNIIAQLQISGLKPEQIMLLGFSQGACLALEYAARHAARYRGVAALSGGLIGAQLNPGNYTGDFNGTPFFLGCSDRDMHIPLERVKASTALLGQLGAAVTERIYPGLGHTINADEIEHVRQMLS